MARYEHLFFVCNHRRECSDPRGSCRGKGSEEVVDRLKGLIHQLGLRKEVRVVESGCLNFCERGVTLLALSRGKEEQWCTELSPETAESFLRTHVGKHGEE